MTPMAVSALLQLGWEQVMLYGIYQLGMKTGHYRRSMPVGGKKIEGPVRWNLSRGPFHVPVTEQLRQISGAAEAAVIEEAEEIVAGKVRIFGGEAVPLRFTLPGPLEHWTRSESKKAHWLEGQDIKYIWEPARFGWVYPLGRAFILTGDERYPATFWKYAAEFLEQNPPNLGPHWASAQEVALRLLSLIFAAQVFEQSETAEEWSERLPRAMVEHARRIPLTLVYSRSQNNNHLLTEALGLYAAGVVLPEYEEAPHWRKLGWKWFNSGLQTQIAADGTYAQHSTNYHRLMLHTALIANALAQRNGDQLPDLSRERLAAATKWFQAQIDPHSGEMTNLGANDGANILPLTGGAFRDGRATLQAAAQVFLGKAALPAGAWDELALWLLGKAPEGWAGEKPCPDSWASLRAVRFTSRPSHADQLHMELWWRGLNLARDAGTYLYNAPAPWDNALAGTAVHNTVMVDGLDQMRRGGRFLWLDWAQARIVVPDERLDGPLGEGTVAAEQDGYRKVGVVHRRCVTRLGENVWQVVDNLLASGGSDQREHAVRLHWLLPDWQYEWGETGLRIQSPFGWVGLEVQTQEGVVLKTRLIRGGEVIEGEGVALPIEGWYSPTYGVKEPGLAFIAESSGRLPVRFVSRWILGEEG